MRLALLALLLPLAGCASTTLIDAANPADLARIQARERGRTADITLTSGDLYRGTLVFLRPDSTSWEEDAGVFAVPTDDVVALVIDNRRKTLGRGALTGAGIAAGLCFGVGAAVGVGFGNTDSENLALALVLGVGCAPGGAIYGVLGGAVTARRTEYIFVDPPTDDMLDAPPDAVPAGDGE